MIVVAGSPAAGQSQASTGQVSGRATDASGGVMTGVTVMISSAETSVRREVLTNERGLYVISLLPAGSYELSATLPGFRSVKRTDVQVTVGSTLTVDLPMLVEGVAEIVDVTAVSPAVEVTSPVASTTLDLTLIAELPTNGRRFQDLVVLTPSAQLEIQRGQIALSGQRGINSNISVDGTDYNEPFFGGIRGGSRSNFAPTIPQEAVREFQVIASGYSPEFGRSTGGVVNVVTRSGTNSPSGGAFYLNRHSDLAADNVFGQAAAPTQQQWGASFGAPIRRDRSFVFAACEQQEVNMPRAVLFDALRGFTPADDTREAFEYFRSLEEPFIQTNDAVTCLGRLDWQAADSRQFNVRYNGSRNVGLNAISPGNNSFPTTPSSLSYSGTEKDQTNTVVAQLTNARRSNLLFEIRGQYSREGRPREANAIATRVQTNVGRFGTASFLGQTMTLDWRGQAAASVTAIAGGHTMKAGTEINHVFIDSVGGLNQTGAFTVSGTNARTILQILSAGPTRNRFDSPAVTYSRQIGNLQQTMATNEIAVFAQDSWRAARSITLTYGLRWEGQWNPPPEVNNRALVDSIAGFTFPSGRQVDPTVVPDARAEIAPRAGFAWNPRQDATLVVRGNAGVYYARSPTIIFAGPLGAFRLPPADLSVQLPFDVPAENENQTVYKQLKLIGIDLNQYPLGSLPIITPDQIARVSQALGLPLGAYTGAQLTLVDPHFKNPRAYQWGFDVERAIAPGLIMGAEYSDVRTVNLERNVDLNVPVPVVRSFDPAQRPFFGLRDGTGKRPIESLASVIVRTASARSQYRALTVRARVQRRWLALNASYVLSKSLSDDDNEADVGGPTLENHYNLVPEYSFARQDRRHQVSDGWVLLLPRGVEAAGHFQFRSGVPIDAIVGGDANQDSSGAGADRPYRAPGVPFERNSFRNRPMSSVNLRLLKNVVVSGKRSVSIIMDVFNLFNVDGIQLAGPEVTKYCSDPAPLTCGFDAPSNPNFLQVIDRNPASSRFGQYLLNNTPGEPRQIQLAVRVSF
jgi:hypothetical protein